MYKDADKVVKKVMAGPLAISSGLCDAQTISFFKNPKGS